MAELKKDLNKPAIIAFYLPQFHPIPENDLWWGKGFTEWTNVGKAKPLFPGHYQPHVPADLGYYDLRVPETREQQAEMARQYGIDGFCYWHYWFGNGKQLLERPFNEVLESGRPDFPFCLGWANHSWKIKTWSNEGKFDKLLIEQKYPGVQDCKDHFKLVSKAFIDNRYLKIDGKPIFLVWEPESIPKEIDYVKIWREEARINGLKGIVFIGFTFYQNKIDYIYKLGYDYVVYDAIKDVVEKNKAKKFIKQIIRKIFNIPFLINYSKYQKEVLNVVTLKKALPCVIPNFDHSPRSGKYGLILQSSPLHFKNFLIKIKTYLKAGKLTNPIIFIKSWNEWGEGNHLEPDLKYSKSYLESLKEGLRD